MSTVPVFVGLDYSLTGVQVCVLNREGKMLGNQKVPDRVDAIVQAASRFGPVHSAAIEACCGASDLAEQIVQQHGWLIHLGHPGYVARIKQNPDKTDFSDATWNGWATCRGCGWRRSAFASCARWCVIARRWCVSAGVFDSASPTRAKMGQPASARFRSTHLS